MAAYCNEETWNETLSTTLEKKSLMDSLCLSLTNADDDKKGKSYGLSKVFGHPKELAE